ncbi:uncharacterized protein [Panulirus ornatus]|uniref:uncharacterized protein n=1 Tax=Panulirus ornatus TaxID=150431 RepID=UPI003A83AFB4
MESKMCLECSRQERLIKHCGMTETDFEIPSLTIVGRSSTRSGRRVLRQLSNQHLRHRTDGVACLLHESDRTSQRFQLHVDCSVFVIHGRPVVRRHISLHI